VIEVVLVVRLEAGDRQHVDENVQPAVSGAGRDVMEPLVVTDFFRPEGTLVPPPPGNAWAGLRSIIVFSLGPATIPPPVPVISARTSP
jgi:hypothetical protein